MDRLTVPARFECLGQVRDFVRAEAQSAGLDPQAVYRLQLGVDELVSNTIEHGYASPECGKTIALAFKDEDACVKIILEDEGQAFDPRQYFSLNDLYAPFEARRPGGFGIFLSINAIDELLYERDGERNRLICVMKKGA